MSVPVSTATLPKMLWPGINSIWGQKYKLWDDGSEWKMIFDVQKSNKNFEEDVGITGMGLVPQKPEGEATKYNSIKQGFVTRYQNLEYGMGIIVTLTEIEDCLYLDVLPKRVNYLAFSTNQTRETVCANVLNRAFNNSYPGGDGVSAINALHPIDGGTFSNTLTTAADLSEASLEDAAIDIYGFVDGIGNKIRTRPESLIIPRQLEFEATRILKNTQWRPETANRDINALVSNGTFPKGIIMNHFLSNPKAWFIKTNCPDGLKYMNRIEPTFTDDNDFDTDNLKYKVRFRFSVLWTDPRGLYGSPGA